MALPKNLSSLHTGEEKLRAKSLAFIEERPDLIAHLEMIHEMMNYIYAHVQEHDHKSPDELTLQMIGIRLFNAAGAGLKLVLSGYYQNGFMMIRDILETTFLLDYFRTHPEKIRAWQSDSNAPHFWPKAVRDALDKRDGYKEKKREAEYKSLCNHASHVSASGFRLTAPEGQGCIGIFFDEKLLGAFIGDLVTKLSLATFFFVPHFKNTSPELKAQGNHFTALHMGWAERFLSDRIPA